MMTFNEFQDYVKRYKDLEKIVNQLYNWNMLSDDNPLDKSLGLISELICRDFGADNGWFLYWVYEFTMHVQDWTTDKIHDGVDFWVEGDQEMYDFLKENPIAKEECWL